MKLTTRKKVQLIIIFFSVFLLVQFGRIFYTIIDENEEIIDAPIAEYHNLFTPEAHHKLQIIVSGKSKNRGFTSSYLFDNKFNIFIYKKELVNNVWLLPMDKILNIKDEESHISMNAIYAELPSYNFKMSLKGGRADSAKVVFFRKSGNIIKPIAENDSLSCYYYHFNTFSVSYNDEPYDVIAESGHNTPASILFLKKRNFLYVILLTVASGKEELEQGLLYHIIKK